MGIQYFEFKLWKESESYQNKIIGQLRVAAKLNAACESPSDAAPSPKYVMTQRSLFLRSLKAYAAPTACGICVAVKKVTSLLKKNLVIIDNILIKHTQRTRNGDEIKFLRTIMDGHLSSFTSILNIAITLIDEIGNGKSTPN